MADSPEGSPLSSIASEEFTEDMKFDDMDATIDSPRPGDAASDRPSKRRRTDTAWDNRTSVSHQSMEDFSDISSDTSGDVPSAAWDSGILGLADDEGTGQEQVTICRWDGCKAGDLGNMDELVQHIHDQHIGMRQKKYSCEWEDCIRKGMPHASGYALRAHMRSHTREKPFYCALPECDRSFTRSDALAKHMRTVHETEALRPSDPVPKHHSSANAPPPKTQRLKLICTNKDKDQANTANGRGINGASDGDGNEDDDATIADETDMDAEGHVLPLWEYPTDTQFTEDELQLAPNELFRILRRQIHWAEEDNTALKFQVSVLETQHKKTWQEKELTLANLMEAKLAEAIVRNSPNYAVSPSMADDLPQPMLPLSGPVPWYRNAKEIERLEDGCYSGGP
ncbi:MAG: hypothetical protein M1834_008195 [Cirrosporium novae-zelandiae]|nr:MAG: hypothetical protein M1834_008195 [Cirrosporium novae-zelandiae]